MNTDYWCFGSRYPRSTRNNNPLIHLDRSSSRYTNILQHGKSFSSKNLCNFDRETNKVGSGFLIFLQRSILFFILQGWFDALSSVTRHFFPLSGSRSCLWSIAATHLPRQMGVVIVSSWRKRRIRYTQTPYYRVERSIRLLRSVQCFAGWEAGSESYVDVDGDGEIGSGW